jgi:glycosyltransferase involved in cell wall biosynthesis
LPSPIDLARFTPRGQASGRETFRVGRMSRDVVDKHHEESPALYRRLISAGCTVRIMGGTTLRKWIPDVPEGLELLPFGAEDGSIFLRELDCFLYRTSDQWFETFGRVVFEAMACGLPVVAHRRAGYSHFLRDGEDILLFDTDDEAFALVMRLKADAGLTAWIARNARRRVEEMFSPSSLDAMTRYFVAGESEACSMWR